MYIKFKRNLQHRAMIDITSLIDLVFLLVAFFMVTSSLGSESTITVHLPKAVQSGEYKKNKLIISINKDNRIFLNDKPHDKDKLLNELIKRRKVNSNLTVVIRGDKRADYDTIVSIMDYLNRAGIPKFTLSTVK
jgi:biopolymer transport protein ExbD